MRLLFCTRGVTLDLDGVRQHSLPVEMAESDALSTPPPPKKRKYASKFQESWLTSKDFDGIAKSHKGETYAHCKYCRADFSVAAGGKNDIDRHVGGKKHKSSVKALSTTVKTGGIAQYMAVGADVDGVIKAETMFSNWLVHQNLPFSAADEFSRMVGKMFPDSKIAKCYSSGRTKTTMIVKGALFPEKDAAITSQCQTGVFALLCDGGSDHGAENKDFVILVRVFDEAQNVVKTRFLDMPICNHATGQNLFDCIKNALQSRSIPWCNMIAFNSDTANVMFGKKNSVVSRLKEVQPLLIDLGCICHLESLCAVAAVKSLPVNVEELLIDIFYHFYYSVKRKEAFREYQEFCGVQMQCVLKHATTRWLSLQKCINRTIRQWPALMSYFTSHEDVEKAGRVKRVAMNLNNTEFLLYMHFLNFILGPLNTFNTLFQSEESKIVILHDEMTRLVQSTLTKFVKARVVKDAASLMEVPFEPRENQLEDGDLEIGLKTTEVIHQCHSTSESEADPMEQEQQLSLDPSSEARFYTSVRLFYITLVKKMLQKFPLQNLLLKDLRLLQPTVRLDLTAQVACRLADSLPSHVVPLEKRDELKDEFRDWQMLEDDSLPSCGAGDRLDKYWGGVAKMRDATGKLRFEQLCKLTKALLTIPCSNAGSERIFSMVRKISTDFRSELGHDTICALLSVKQNSDEKPSQLNPSKQLLRAAKSSTHKYNSQHKASTSTATSPV